MIAYRQANYGSPLRVVPSAEPGRYHRGDENEPTQYLCLHPLGPLAELMRRHDLRTREQVRELRVRTCALAVEIDDLPELTVENDGRGLVSDDLRSCQARAGRLRRETPGIVVPSAALPGTRNVVLFGARVAAPYLAEPIATIDVPASITADAGRPPFGLVDLVRFRGDRYRPPAGGFAEPDWELAA